MTPCGSYTLPKLLGETVLHTPSNSMLVQDHGLQRLRGQIVSRHLEGEQAFLMSISEVTVPVEQIFVKVVESLVSDKAFWKKIAFAVRDLALIALTSIGAYFLFREAKNQLAWIGNHKIVSHLSDDYRYSSVFSQSDYNRRFLPSAFFLASFLAFNFLKLRQSVVDLSCHIKDRIQQIKKSNSYCKIKTKAAHELDLDNLINQKIAGQQESWREPITLSHLDKQKVLSPATLIIRNMAFSLEAALILFFYRDKDANKDLKFIPAEPKLILKHPCYLDILIDSDQAQVVQQICDAFLIDSVDFSKCWEVQESLIPQTDYSDVENWYLLTYGIIQELEQLRNQKTNDFEAQKTIESLVIDAITGKYKMEYANFLANERAVYMQMMRFNNFCKLIPSEAAAHMESKLTKGLAEKLSRVRQKEALCDP